MAKILRIALIVAAFLWVKTATSAFDGCSTAISDTGGGKVVECEDPCSATCDQIVISVPGVGDGRICTCGPGGTWTGCCVVMLSAAGDAVAVGDCGGKNCPWSGTCEYEITIRGLPGKPEIYYRPRCL